VESLTALFPGGFSLLLQASLFRFYERVGTKKLKESLTFGVILPFIFIVTLTRTLPLGDISDTSTDVLIHLTSLKKYLLGLEITLKE
jgi:hypothetical protein